MPVQTHSQYPLVSVAHAQEVVARESQTLPAEEVDLSNAAGRVLAETVTAKDDLPPFPASIKVRPSLSFLAGAADALYTRVARPGTSAMPSGMAQTAPSPPLIAGRIRRGVIGRNRHLSGSGSGKSRRRGS